LGREFEDKTALVTGASRGIGAATAVALARAGVKRVVIHYGSYREGAEDTVRDLLSDVAGLSRSVGFRVPDGELACVVGIGSHLWDRLFAPPRPARLHPMQSCQPGREGESPGVFSTWQVLLELA